MQFGYKIYFCPVLSVNDISFAYQPEIPVLERISFNLAQGEHLCIMGESGCGKSTLLKLLYGLMDLDEGSIFWSKKEVLGPKFNLIPGMKFFKYVAQDFDLMPFTTVYENISHYLPRTEPEKTRKKTLDLIELIGMSPFTDTKVKTLSGGQKQRVALARALAQEPELLLLDEPFSQIDSFKKNALRRMLFSYLKEKKISCIVATHDSEDALSFADKLLILKDNQAIQFGSAKELYQNPNNAYSASLFDDVNQIKLEDKTLLRYPHQIRIVKQSNLKARVQKTYFKGAYWLIELEFNKQKIYLNHPENLDLQHEVCLDIDT